MMTTQERLRPVTRSDARNLTASPGNLSRQVTVGNHRLSLTAPHPLECGALYERAKRTGDFLTAAVLLILLFPVFIAVALAIFLEDGGAILYYQPRVGKDGREFRFYKFRSMKPNADALKEGLTQRNEADGPIFKMKRDPRITRVGRLLRRYSIDELPQLVNVLRGEMSLIGPRPHLPKEVALYAERQKRRTAVQPGLLCFREVYGRSELSFEEWVELDLLYLQYRSIRTDFLILMRTIPAALSAEGAY